MLLENKIALITGASRGIGRATAIALADEGALVVLLGRNEGTLQKVRSEIELMGGRADIEVCDLSDKEQIISAAQNVLQKYKRIDVLVNNAAISKELPFLDMTLDTFDELMRVDFHAPMLMMKEVLPSMVKNNSGAIVNVGAAVGERGGPGTSAYAAAKAALINLTRSVGEEVKRLGVRVNCVCPGPMNTELFRASSTCEYEMKRGGDFTRPETVANTILYLASDMSRGMNCQIVTVRGANRW